MPGLKLILPLTIVAGLFMRGCDEDSPVQPSARSIGDPVVGAQLIDAAGCGGCHIIPGIDRARGLVGPPLNHMGRRAIIAGLLENTPANMMTWLMDPQAIVPGNAMPDMGLTETQARHITAYLYTLE